MQWAIYTDTADYPEWKTGRRATALIMAASLFALKMGVALGGAILGAFLMVFYPLSNQRMITIEADLTDRRKQSKSDLTV